MLKHLKFLNLIASLEVIGTLIQSSIMMSYTRFYFYLLVVTTFYFMFITTHMNHYSNIHVILFAHCYFPNTSIPITT